MALRICNKIILIVINILLIITCAGLFYIGINSLREYSNYSHLVPTVYMIGLPVGVIFFIGSLIFVVAVVGLAATSTEAKCLVATYCTLQLVTVVLLMAAIGLLFACENTVSSGLEKNISTGLQNYFLDPNITKEIDYLQRSLKCCGVNNYTDWTDTPWYRNQSSSGSCPYPESCCPKSNCSSNSTSAENVFRWGCYSAMDQMLLHQFIISSSVCASVAFILVLGFMAICILYHNRPNFEYIGLVEDGAVRV